MLIEKVFLKGSKAQREKLSLSFRSFVAALLAAGLLLIVGPGLA